MFIKYIQNMFAVVQNVYLQLVAEKPVPWLTEKMWDRGATEFSMRLRKPTLSNQNNRWQRWTQPLRVLLAHWQGNTRTPSTIPDPKPFLRLHKKSKNRWWGWPQWHRKPEHHHPRRWPRVYNSLNEDPINRTTLEARHPDKISLGHLDGHREYMPKNQ